MGETLVTSSLYESDFYGWTVEQATLLRAGRLEDTDLEHLVEEIEALGRSEMTALRSSLRLIAMHLLKAIHQPDKARTSWRVTVVRERINAERTLKDNPGLKSTLRILFVQAYADARKLARRSTCRYVAPTADRIDQTAGDTAQGSGGSDHRSDRTGIRACHHHP